MTYTRRVFFLFFYDFVCRFKFLHSNVPPPSSLATQKLLRVNVKYLLRIIECRFLCESCKINERIYGRWKYVDWFFLSFFVMKRRKKWERGWLHALDWFLSLRVGTASRASSHERWKILSAKFIIRVKNNLSCKSSSKRFLTVARNYYQLRTLALEGKIRIGTLDMGMHKPLSKWLQSEEPNAFAPHVFFFNPTSFYTVLNLHRQVWKIMKCFK